MTHARRLWPSVASLILALVCTDTARAAVYLPMPDRDLASEAVVVVHARAVAQKTVLGPVAGESRPFTATTFERLEALKGDVAGTFDVRTPGGVSGGLAWMVPGTPTFALQVETVLFLAPMAGGQYRLTELGLSKFDVVEDASGRRFAIRSFRSETDDYLSGRGPEPMPGPGPTVQSASRPVRDLESFLSALRAQERGEESSPIEYAVPSGELVRRPRGASPLWVNIGGREPGSACGSVPCLFRWFWDTGTSPNGVVYTTGTQTNLTDGSNGVTHVQNAVDKWHNVAGSDVRYSGVSSSTAGLQRIDAGNVNVKLDVTTSDDGTTWTTPLGCNQSGILGLGGPDSSPPAPGPFKGDGNYYAIKAATVQMRKISCGSGYPANMFRSAVLHEVGHTLGLGHPDQAQSTHSTTTSADWNNAVMRSFIPSSFPDTPQTDDVQAIQFYYPGAGGAPCSADATTFCANNSRFKVQVLYTTAATAPQLEQAYSPNSSGPGQAVPLTSDTGYFWFFSANNVEMVIKVVDGRAVNNKFWVFAAGLTNVNVVITVTDTQTGAVKTYVNPQGVAFAPIQDTSAFSTTPEEAVKVAPGDGAADAASAAITADLGELLGSRGKAKLFGSEPAAGSELACAANATTLCLNNNRFQVRTTWATTDGRNGSGQAVALTGDTGYFWFFSSNNVEMVVKVVTGCPLNSKYWVFAGGLTNVNVVMTVTDTQAGAVKQYINPQGVAFAPIQDTSAFACP